MDRDAGVFGAGIGYSITEQWSVYADYAADVSDKVRHNVNMASRLNFKSIRDEQKICNIFLPQ